MAHPRPAEGPARSCWAWGWGEHMGRQWYGGWESRTQVASSFSQTPCGPAVEPEPGPVWGPEAGVGALVMPGGVSGKRGCPVPPPLVPWARKPGAAVCLRRANAANLIISTPWGLLVPREGPKSPLATLTPRRRAWSCPQGAASHQITMWKRQGEATLGVTLEPAVAHPVCKPSFTSHPTEAERLGRGPSQ